MIGIKAFVYVILYNIRYRVIDLTHRTLRYRVTLYWSSYTFEARLNGTIQYIKEGNKMWERYWNSEIR